MPHVVQEFNWVLHPILVLGPSVQEIKTFFEEAGFELTTELSDGNEVGLRSFAVSGPGPLNFWMSATLGKRGKGSSRLSLLGVSLEDNVDELSRLLTLVDGIVLLAQKDHPHFEKLIKEKIGPGVSEKPWVFVAHGSDESSLRLKALKTWLKEKMDRVFWSPRPEHVLEDSLNWILEESV